MLRLITVASTAAVLTASVALAQGQPETFPLKDKAGAQVGTATLTDGPRGVLMRLEVKGLTPGWHGLHFHEKADCGDAKFENAGEHVHTQASVVHGLLNPDATEAGDLPNIHVARDGTGATEILATAVSLKQAGTRAELKDRDGSALIIHEKADDHRSQPIGGSGDRIACALIR